MSYTVHPTKYTPCTVAADQKGKTMDKNKRDVIEEVLDKHLQTAMYNNYSVDGTCSSKSAFTIDSIMQILLCFIPL